MIVACLSVPTMIAHRTGRRKINTVLGYLIESIVTVFLVWSVVRLVRSLPSREVTPESLLRSAAALWICNVVLFSLWYWRLDAGGPYARHNRVRHEEGAFLFPPMTNDGKRTAGGHWSPKFVDYLFLSFNTSTALSPTDTAIISRWAKSAGDDAGDHIADDRDRARSSSDQFVVKWSVAKRDPSRLE